MSRIVEYDVISAEDSETLIDKVNDRIVKDRVREFWWEPIGGVCILKNEGTNEHKGTTYVEYEHHQAMVRKTST